MTTQAAKAQEPSMEEILASIRRIIADDDASKPAGAPDPAAGAKQGAAGAAQVAPARPAPTPAATGKSATPSATPAAPAKPAANNQDDIDAMLAELDAPPKATPKQAGTAAGNAPAEAAGEILDLTESMTTPPPGPAPSFRTIEGNSDVVFSSKPQPQVQTHAQAHAQSNAQPDRGLISNETIAAVDSAFNSLAHTVIGQNARTLEDLVREMLRPMLKSWLDDNLPGLVERIVRAEIERVSRGRP
jgi:cell pole-organizing protein PopZ